MGSVKIDVNESEKKYYSTSYSSVEDVYEIIERLDKIYVDAYDGNYEALVILIDLRGLVRNIESKIHKDFMEEYLDIQTGQKPMVVNDYGKKILDVVSERLGVDREHCENLYVESIDMIIKNNYDDWLRFINNNYFNKKVSVEKPKKILESKISDESFYATDYIKKYVNPKFIYDKEELPTDLQQFINYELYNYNEIKCLKQELKQEKDKDKRKFIKDFIVKRTKIKIELCKDISELKKIHRIPIEKTNKKGKNFNYSYNENQDYLINDENYNIINEINANKIKRIAKNILTERQYIVFNLYYNIGLTQQKIAKILNDDQRNITNDLKYLTKKIKLEL